MVCCLGNGSNVRNGLIDGIVKLLYYSCIKIIYFHISRYSIVARILNQQEMKLRLIHTYVCIDRVDLTQCNKSGVNEDNILNESMKFN